MAMGLVRIGFMTMKLVANDIVDAELVDAGLGTRS